MPKTGRCNWADLIARALKALGGMAHLSAIYKELEKFPEAQEKFRLCRSRCPGRAVDIQAQIRVLLSARDPRFERVREKRGFWTLRTAPLPAATSTAEQTTDAPAERNYSMPACYKDRSERILKLMNRVDRKHLGWAQKEIARELDLDINAVNKVINFMKTEGLIKVVSGKGKTQNPFRYAPADGVLERHIIIPTRERKLAVMEIVRNGDRGQPGEMAAGRNIV